MISVRTAVLLFAIMALLVSPSLSQQREQFRRGPGAERIEQFKKIRMMEAMKLDEETSIRFFARYNKHQESLQALHAQRETHLQNLESLRRQNASDEQLLKAVRDFRSLDGAVVDARARFLDELREVLNVRQIADYVAFEENFNRYLRELMRDIQRERTDRRPMR
jgi:DNA repair exonuclease SbcCD ATPase subunit